MTELVEALAFLEEAKRAERNAVVILQALYPPGTPLEFRSGNMAHVQDATAIRVCAWHGVGLEVRNDETGAERKILISEIVEAPPVTKGTKTVELTEPCPECRLGLPAGETRKECSACGNVLVLYGGDNG